MKHLEFYRKYKTSYTPILNPLFSKRNWWRISLISFAAMLVGPLILYKNQRSIPLSFGHYLLLMRYFLIIVLPLLSFLIWANWRESLKRTRGYKWIGKFEVINKQTSLAFRYLLLSPGNGNRIKVDRDLFERTRAGDFIVIRRDALGNIEEINKVNNFPKRLARSGTKGFKGSIEPWSMRGA